jgi:16S rRNA (uracil1498-N3)-methyltransferase|tara:strand:+ start:1294 stop:2031 length:738 start_codon:yes stop_codon:yes gene_type:complete
LPEHRHFIINPENLTGDRFILNGQEGHHAARVTRMNSDDEITLLDGSGAAYGAVVDTVNGDRIEGRIIDKIDRYNEPTIHIHLGVGILKGVKMDTVIEKCTELGVRSVTPLVLDNSVKQNINLQRLKKISLSAIKQCGRGLLPDVNDAQTLHEWSENSSGELKFMLHDSPESAPLMAQLMASNPHSEVRLLVGPEGGFSPAEVEALSAAGFIQASLGRRRLRAETAAIMAVVLSEQILNQGPTVE